MNLHRAGVSYTGEGWGWPVYYEPQIDEAPIDSKMRFIPASFFIGRAFIWSISYTWEHGSDASPLVHQER